MSNLTNGRKYGRIEVYWGVYLSDKYAGYV